MTDKSPKFISISEVCKRTSLSRTTVNQKRQEGEFPLPVSLGLKRIAFVESEIDAWIQARVAERELV